MARLNTGNVAIYVFVVIVLTLLVLAAIGYMTGGWDQQPPPLR